MLVHAFLKARSDALPGPRVQHAAPIVQEESQEDYGDFGFDLNDPAVAAALGDVETEDIPDIGEVKNKEGEACKVKASNWISCAVYAHCS